MTSITRVKLRIRGTRSMHGDNGWMVALLVYVLPSICNFFLEFIDYFCFCSITLFHIAFNRWGTVPSLLLKLEKLNLNVRRASHVWNIKVINRNNIVPYVTQCRPWVGKPLLKLLAFRVAEQPLEGIFCNNISHPNQGCGCEHWVPNGN
jgi:hypothetical protein